MWTDDGLLGDDLISKLAALGPIESKGQIKAVLERTWLHWDRYGNSLFTLLSNLDIPPFQPLPTKTRKATNHEPPVEAPTHTYSTVGSRVNGKRKRGIESDSMLASNPRPRLTAAPPPQPSASPLRTPPVVPSQRRDMGYLTAQTQDIEYKHANPRREAVLPYPEGKIIYFVVFVVILIDFQAPGYRTMYGGLASHAGTPTLAQAPPVNTPTTPTYGTPFYPTHPPYANLYQNYYPYPPYRPNGMAHFHYEPSASSPAPPATPIQHPPTQQQPYYHYLYPRYPPFDM
ncbi:hypothetical protein RSOL_261670, partial [Rhizoctonia solani AG-3 Rhs1AP]